MLRRFWYLPLLFFLAIPAYAAEYRIGGVNPEAILCRPEGNGPFPAVLHNHGVGIDTSGYARSVRRGYDLPGICKALAHAGFLTFIPVRQGGPGSHMMPSHKSQVLQAIDYVKGLPDVDPSRVAVTGNSRGAILTLMVASERRDLKALVVMAPADVGSYFSRTLPEVPSIDAPVLILVEAGDKAEIQDNFDALDRALKQHKKEVKSIRYTRGGGHNLFHTTGYYLEDVKSFLREKLDGK